MRLASPNDSKENDMKTRWQKVAAGFSVVVMALLLSGVAIAQCPGGPVPKAKLHRQSWGAGNEGARLVLASDETDPIVGMWRVKLTTGDQTIDEAISQWHGDGTEIMNSSRNPETQSFCLGVWQNAGNSTYRLNHYAISWDQGFSTTQPLGLANIRESVTLAKDGKSFFGTFTINQYDEQGNTLVTITGTIVGYRIDLKTNLKVLF